MEKLPYTAMIILIFGFICIATISYWMLYPYKPVEISYFHIDSPVEGNILKYTISYCKYFDSPTSATRQLIDNAIIFLPMVMTNNPIGCFNNSERFVELPDFAPNDTYFMRTSVTYKVNPIRSITVTADSNKFYLQRNYSCSIMR